MEGPRAYEDSHPHINFRIDLRVANPSLWALLGEAKSKSEHVARTILRPDVSRELLQIYLTKGALATTAIEGNTLSEDEARRIIEGQLKLPRSKEYLQKEIENVVEAYTQVKDELLSNESRDLTVEDIVSYNAMVLDGLELEEGVVAGEIRDYSVTVGAYRAAPARDLPYLLQELCDLLNGPTFRAPDDKPELAAPLAIVAAVIAHLYLAWIHPFGDGNGRVARLLEHWVLLKAGFPAPTTQLLSNHYNATRSEYYRHLHNASRTGEVMPFVTYAAQGFVDGLSEQLDRIWDQVFQDRWEQYVYEQFGEEKSEASRRRLHLVLDVSKAAYRDSRVVRRADMPTLTPRLAVKYADKTSKTLTRDINVVTNEMDLLMRHKGGFIPNDSILFGFRPECTTGVLNARTPFMP